MTPPNIYVPSRRNFFKGLALTAAYMTAPGAFAEALTLTPKQTEGPFYPDKLPLDTDNDLLILNDNITPAVGTVTWVSGRVLDKNGQPIRNAVVEIWQCDNNGAYLHTGTDNKTKADQNFQGFGRFLTGATGEYLFRTIKPVPYPGRTPHIHYAIKMKGREKWTTQLYIEGHEGNPKDGIWKNLNEQGRAAVTKPFAPVANSKAGELAAKFDLVMGYTPEV
jgi:protocatechuate 3,4-dioxygenase, beta subunit